VRLKDFLSMRLPGVRRDYLPSRAKLLGGAALLRLRPEIMDLKREIGESTLEFYGGRARAVYLVYGVEGVERKPILELIAGEPVREVLHREYGCIFKLDLTRMMFCLGNSFERLRVAGLVGGGEVVVDMFAGVGQFSIPIALLGDPGEVYAIEINPEAHRYLMENVRLNRVEGIIRPILGDCKRVVEERLREVADRVVMGYLGGTIEALPAALKALKPTGGVVHFHELAKRGVEGEFVEAVLERARGMGYEVRLISWRRVKSYSKTRNHVVIDFLAVKSR